MSLVTSVSPKSSVPLLQLSQPLTRLEVKKTSPKSKALIPNDHSYYIFLASALLWRKHGSGRIIFLCGCSSVGKTSICNEIKKIDPSIIIDGIDAAMDRHYLNLISDRALFKKHFPDKYKVLERCVEEKEITSFLRGNVVKFKKTCTLNDRKEAVSKCAYIPLIEDLFFDAFHRNVAQENLFERAMALSTAGRDVVIDAVESRDFHLYKVRKVFYCPLLVTLVHCSFEKLAQHKEKRNELALKLKQPQEARYGTFPFLQFTDFFKPRESLTEPQAHVIDKATIVRIYDRHLKEEMTYRPNHQASEEDIRQRRDFELGILFTRLGVEGKSEGKEVELTPLGEFDLCLDTGILSPKQSASKLID